MKRMPKGILKEKFLRTLVSVAAMISNRIFFSKYGLCFDHKWSVYSDRFNKHLDFFIPKRVSGKVVYYKHGPESCQIIANIGDR